MWSKTTSIPRHHAAASLKPDTANKWDAITTEYSAASRRGLIEASVAAGCRTGLWTYSAASRRGLIEATSGWSYGGGI